LGDGVDAERMIDLQIHDTPDILIIPSQFKHFVKPIDHGNTIVINPGHLCRHQAGGTYARVIMYPRESIQERIRVDLFKL
jgi:DNA polymerase alpha subunit B